MNSPWKLQIDVSVMKPSFSCRLGISPQIGRLFRLMAATLFMLAACGGKGPYKIDLMPAPDIFADGAVDPFSDSGFVDTGPNFGVLYATDREPAPEGHKERFYQNERGYLIRLGAARVELGVEGITWEEARRISLLKSRTDKYPLRVEHVQEFGILEDSFTILHDPEMLALKSGKPAQRFASLINSKLSQSRRKDIYIYVHGFKVNFENPVLVTSELWHFLGYDGVFIAYAWPSTPSVFAYASDAETAATSARNLRTFLKYLARETSAERIHIIGYSSGTRVVTGALGQLALLNRERDKKSVRESLRIGNVILVGSDVDRGIFAGNVLDGMLKVQTVLSVYSSATDSALGMSSFFFGRKRMGQAERDEPLRPAVKEFLRTHDDINIIDATDAENADAANGHAYFRDSPWVSSDILMTLMYGLSPEQRGLKRTEERPIWTFPPDYVANLLLVLQKVNPDLFQADEDVAH